MKYLINLIDLAICSILMIFYYPFYPKNIWIVSEREMQAQDNGIAFFKYLNNSHKEISSYYLIHKDSKELEKIKEIGNVLIIGSIKHKLFFLKSEVIATTEKNIIEPWGSNVFYKYFNFLYPKKTRVFLQHGITDKDVSHVYGNKVSNFDLFITASERERKFIIDKFSYSKQQVVCTGFSRYDWLKNKEKSNYILYMPTWRRNLVNPEELDKEKILESRNQFIKSKYYLEIMNLLNNKKLGEILTRYDFKLLFITHHTINSFIDLFSSNLENIEILKSEDVAIKDMLLKSKLLITDYSSVHFDSAYLGNGNLYYQFDRDDFFEKHAGKSYYSYENDGFGPVTDNLDELIDYIQGFIENNCSIDNIYKQRVESFFAFKDYKNSQRIYESIKDYQQNIKKYKR